MRFMHCVEIEFVNWRLFNFYTRRAARKKLKLNEIQFNFHNLQAFDVSENLINLKRQNTLRFVFAVNFLLTVTDKGCSWEREPSVFVHKQISN